MVKDPLFRRALKLLVPNLMVARITNDVLQRLLCREDGVAQEMYVVPQNLWIPAVRGAVQPQLLRTVSTINLQMHAVRSCTMVSWSHHKCCMAVLRPCTLPLLFRLATKLLMVTPKPNFGTKMMAALLKLFMAATSGLVLGMRVGPKRCARFLHNLVVLLELAPCVLGVLLVGRQQPVPLFGRQLPGTHRPASMRSCAHHQLDKKGAHILCPVSWGCP